MGLHRGAESLWTCPARAALPEQKQDCCPGAALGAGWDLAQGEFQRAHLEPSQKLWGALPAIVCLPLVGCAGSLQILRGSDVSALSQKASQLCFWACFLLTLLYY